MLIYGDLDFQSANFVSDAKLRLAIETDYPQTPQAGRVLFIDKRLMMCVEVLSGVPVWVPLTQEIDTYIHTQTLASDVWVIDHNFNTNSVFVQIIDQNGKMIIPDEIDLSVVNRVTVRFNLSIVGRAVIMLGSLSGTPKDNVVYTQSYLNLTTWVVTHGLGYNPVIRCFIGGYQVQPYSIVHDSTTQATVTFSSAETGYVNCL